MRCLRIIKDLYFVADHINEVVDEAQWHSVKAQTQLYKCTYKIAKKTEILLPSPRSGRLITLMKGVGT